MNMDNQDDNDQFDAMRSKINAMKAELTRVQGEAGVLRQLLREASNVMTTIVPEDDTEELVLEVLQDQIAAAIKPTAPQPESQCTCLGSQLGPHYCEVHAA